MGKCFGEFVEAAEVDSVGYLWQFQPRHLERVELFSAFGARGDTCRMLDRLCQQARKLAVGQCDSDAFQSSADSVGVDG